mgnify:CR=1 FL=1
MLLLPEHVKEMHVILRVALTSVDLASGLASAAGCTEPHGRSLADPPAKRVHERLLSVASMPVSRL